MSRTVTLTYRHIFRLQEALRFVWEQRPTDEVLRSTIALALVALDAPVTAYQFALRALKEQHWSTEAEPAAPAIDTAPLAFREAVEKLLDVTVSVVLPPPLTLDALFRVERIETPDIPGLLVMLDLAATPPPAS